MLGYKDLLTGECILIKVNFRVIRDLSMLAVVETGGKQYSIKEGDIIKVEKLKAKQGSEISIDNVLFVNGQSGPVFNPISTVIKAQVLEQRRGEKVIIFKKRRRKNYRRKKGHRQYLTVLRITDIDIKE